MKTDRIWRALSIALALCLTLALAPTCAFATDADAEPAEDGVSTSGVTDVTGGSNTTVKTEVRNNYTDTYERQTVTLVNGTATVEDNFSGLDGRNLTFAGLGNLTVKAAYDAAKDATTFTVDTSSIQRQQEEQQYTAAEVECKTKMTTTYTGSKLTYTGTTYENGKAVIHEIRDDYYTRNHWCVTFRLTIPAAESTTIDSVNVTDATLTYQVGDKPQATAKADASARITCEYWEEMEDNGKGEVVPVKFWYSDPARLAKVPEDKRITHFEAGKRYMYSLMLANTEGHTFAADCALTLNGKAVNSRNVMVGRDGKTLFATALKTLNLTGSETPETPEYRITAGANGVWTKGSETGLTFRANGPIEKFTGIQVDGKTLDSDDYTASSGSTVVTLETTYLETLTEGKHHLTVLYNDGQCGTSFTVRVEEEDPTEDPDDDPTEDTEKKSSEKSDKAAKTASKKTGTPKTGDSADPTLWAAMLTVSGVALGVLCWSKRREQ